MDLEKRNCAEKIIFCIDLCKEVDSLDFCRGGKKSPTRLDLIKQALRIFVFTKQKMNPNHEFAICVLTETTIWYQDLTTDVDIFSKKLMQLQVQGDFTSFNVSSIFDVINTKFPDILAAPQFKSTAAAAYRAILIYSRSNSIPHFEPNQHKLTSDLLDAPNFFFDALYLHSKPSKENRPQDVYDFITEIEGKDHISYFFENSTSMRKFHLHVAHLLCHPLQRPEQSAYSTSLAAAEWQCSADSNLSPQQKVKLIGKIAFKLQ